MKSWNQKIIWRSWWKTPYNCACVSENFSNIGEEKIYVQVFEKIWFYIKCRGENRRWRTIIVHLLSMIYHSCDVKQQSTNLHIHYIGNHQTFQFMNWNLYIDKLLLSLKFVLQEAIMALLLLAAGLTNILVFTQGNVHRLFNHTHTNNI